MKLIAKNTLFTIVTVAFMISTANAGWVIADDNKEGAQLADCCKAKTRVVRRVVKKKTMTPCDAIPTAKTLPVEKGEKLQPANIKRCISCDQKYGSIK